MTADDAYWFDLPGELIAQEPPAERGQSRLLVAERHGRVRGIVPFAELPDLLRDGDLLVVNDSRVLPARLWTRRADTDGEIELLLVRPDSRTAGAWQAMARPARRLRSGQRLLVRDLRRVGSEAELIVLARLETGGVVVESASGEDLASMAERLGVVPLPPYIRRDRETADFVDREGRDRDRYQTVYARTDPQAARSVAAPTAGLHFSPRTLAALEARGVGVARVTLHVGPGTFQPPSDDQLAAGRLHPEAFAMPAVTAAAVARCRAEGRCLVAVGTTSLRVLETVARLGLPADAPPGALRRFEDRPDGDAVFRGEAVRGNAGWEVRGTTRLFLRPPAAVTAADALLTNFHLPGSSLLMLVAAFGGNDLWREAYGAAIEARLRFYSYGDAMLLLTGEGGAR